MLIFSATMCASDSVAALVNLHNNYYLKKCFML